MTDGVDYIVKVSDTANGIHLGNFRKKLVAVSLGKTSRYDNAAEIAVFTKPRHVKYGFYRLFLGALDKRTGVDNDDVGKYIFFDDFKTRVAQLCQHDLAVNLVFRTAERHEGNFYFFIFTHSICQPFSYLQLCNRISRAPCAHFADREKSAFCAKYNYCTDIQNIL